jgi:hypothetical protein
MTALLPLRSGAGWALLLLLLALLRLHVGAARQRGSQRRLTRSLSRVARVVAAGRADLLSSLSSCRGRERSHEAARRPSALCAHPPPSLLAVVRGVTELSLTLAHPSQPRSCPPLSLGSKLRCRPSPADCEIGCGLLAFD